MKRKDVNLSAEISKASTCIRFYFRGVKPIKSRVELGCNNVYFKSLRMKGIFPFQQKFYFAQFCHAKEI